jgi:hypothetical protein
MKQRILTGWSWIRGIYLVTGIMIAVQAAVNGQWLGVALGSYFAAMAVFKFGCAAGSCFGDSCNVNRHKSET